MSDKFGVTEVVAMAGELGVAGAAGVAPSDVDVIVQLGGALGLLVTFLPCGRVRTCPDDGFSVHMDLPRDEALKRLCEIARGAMGNADQEVANAKERAREFKAKMQAIGGWVLGE